ncbi:hypothetical protein HYPSUDRAFT_44331 [Hypholoma sublateritium FD-334 SS-4]|uniref:F-box domain-containing protein n=1 Tax=Hypholoma sublateritium (strain FD-334 SS-4) TaxID=945553 RepID=A0A0D2PH46_HYPSF|nr:hypothetical protein HYPSUDRAFT_44331 [Hypholoma sublateritium FD-334 SS-4]
MSALPGNAPVQRLNFDILWEIIMINADMFNNRRVLETTLATSQVCRSWRRFMLNTPSIWAHLIDFRDRQWYAVKGRRALMRRNGTDMLWIKVPSMFTFGLERTKIISDVVSENWERLRELDVTIRHEDVDQWPLLRQPVPHLESFGITFTQYSTEFKHILSSLFGGSAPMLRELRFNGPSYNCFARPSWMHQLRSLELTVELTVSEMLEVLMVTKHLVNLRLDQILDDDTTSTLLPVSLLKLAHLHMHLTAALASAAVFLDHICIPPECSLNLSMRPILPRNLDKESFAAIIRAISTCARASFTHHAPQYLGLTITLRHFTLETTSHADGPEFKFCMELVPQQIFPEHVRPALLSEFSLPCFSEVTRFRVGISDMNFQVPQIPAFMACLTAVTAIWTDKWSLRYLICAQAAPKGAETGPRSVFSTLKILHLRALLSSRATKSGFDSSTDPVSHFVMANIAHGHVLRVIDFTTDTLEVLPDMEFLREAVGLKVRWRQCGVADICEYICGTGEPQKVEFV